MRDKKSKDANNIFKYLTSEKRSDDNNSMLITPHSIRELSNDEWKKYWKRRK